MPLVDPTLPHIIYSVGEEVHICIPTESVAAAMKDIPDGADYEVVERANLPTDRTFRNAWKKVGAGIQTDLPRAVVIAQDKVRLAREPVFAKLDTAYMRADEIGDVAEKTVIAAKKQTARDATGDARIVNAPNEAQLKAGMEAVITDLEAL